MSSHISCLRSTAGLIIAVCSVGFANGANDQAASTAVLPACKAEAARTLAFEAAPSQSTAGAM